MSFLGGRCEKHVCCLGAIQTLMCVAPVGIESSQLGCFYQVDSVPDKGWEGGKRAVCSVRKFSCTGRCLMEGFLQEGKDEDLNEMPSVHSSYCPVLLIQVH